jgi:hypothetical protein
MDKEGKRCKVQGARFTVKKEIEFTVDRSRFTVKAKKNG